MRTHWIPLSASALVIGAMSLVLGKVLDPAESGSSTTQMMQVVSDEGARWMAMAVMYTFSSIMLALGLPSVLVLLQERGRRTGVVGAVVFTVGVVGTCGYAMLMVFFRALVLHGAISGPDYARVGDDRGLTTFVLGWVATFYAGVLLLALALFLARTVPRWVPALMLVFVVMMPFVGSLGRVGAALQVMALAAAFTGVAVEAVSRDGRAARPTPQPAYT